MKMNLLSSSMTASTPAIIYRKFSGVDVLSVGYHFYTITPTYDFDILNGTPFISSHN